MFPKQIKNSPGTQIHIFLGMKDTERGQLLVWFMVDIEYTRGEYGNPCRICHFHMPDIKSMSMLMRVCMMMKT
jgi:hypothetical protein